MLTTILRVLHILSMALWIGAPIGAVGDIRRTLELGPPHVDALASRIRRGRRLTLAAGLSTLATGLALLLALGGFKAVPVRIHIGMGLSLAALLLGAIEVEPAWRRVARAMEAGGGVAGAQAASKRFAFSIGMEHLVRLTVLVLMAWKA